MIRVAYRELSAGNSPASTLAVVHFGLSAGETPKNVLGIQVRLQPLDANRYSELWSATGPVHLGSVGHIRYACDDQHLFGVIELDEREHGDIASTTALAYSAITEFQRGSAYPHLLRMWNYLDAINQGAGDMERYRQFCIGRGRGLAGMQVSAFPAATAIGHQATTHVLQVYWLAGRAPGAAIENPRQVSAYRYPRVHGPVSPTFARATLTPDRSLLISGTASIVGHVSLHGDDVQAQLEETLRNLSTLRTLASTTGRSTLLKAYVREPAQAQVMAERMSQIMPTEFPNAQIIYLAADICRRELLLEIEGVQLAHG
jgi:chorismate lyase/3-hydroxybenzoate synthase